MTNLLRATWTRLSTNMRDPLQRKNVALFMGGKLLGLTLVLLLMEWFIPTAVHAATGASTPTPTMNAVNTAWTLIAAFLVFCMQVGFVMLEAGFARSRESVNILVEGIADTCICGILFWAWGFAFMFEPGTPIHRHPWLLFAWASIPPICRLVSLSWLSGSSSSLSLIPLRRLLRAR